MTPNWNRLAASAPEPCQPEQQHHGDRGNPLGRPPRREVGSCRCSLAEANRIERNRDRLRQEQHDTDGAAEIDTKRARDHVVVAATTYFEVGGDRSEGEARDDAHRRGDADDDERVAQAGVAHHEAEPKEEDDAEDREDRRREHPGKRAKSAARFGGGRSHGRKGKGRRACVPGQRSGVSRWRRPSIDRTLREKVAATQDCHQPYRLRHGRAFASLRRCRTGQGTARQGLVRSPSPMHPLDTPARPARSNSPRVHPESPHR